MNSLKQQPLLRFASILFVILVLVTCFDVAVEAWFGRRVDSDIFNIATIITSSLVSATITHYLLNRSQKFAKESAERELRSAHFLDSLINHLPIAVFYKDINGCYLGCNDVFCETFGVTHQQIVGKTVFDLWPSDKARIYHQKDMELLASPEHQEYEAVIVNKNAQERDVIYSKNVFRDENNSIIGIVGAFLDITEKNGVKEELLTHQDHLKRMVARLDLVVRQTMEAFTTATVHTDPYTAGHEGRVADLSVAIGKRLGFSNDRLLGLEMAARAHDIGQIKIPAEILLRPHDLTTIEFEFIKQHAEAGWEILKNIEFPWPVAEIVYEHHENYDGSGYPRGLVGEDILLEARIIRVADAVEALSSHRPFRAAFAPGEVVARLAASSGTNFDPRVTDVCLEILSSGYVFPLQGVNGVKGVKGVKAQ